MWSEDDTRKLRTYGEAKRKRTRPNSPNPRETSYNLKNSRYEKKKTQQKRISAMQVLRSGQHLRVYGGNLYQRQPFNPKKAIPRTQQGSEKGLYRFSFGGMSPTIPHGDFTRDCLTP